MQKSTVKGARLSNLQVIPPEGSFLDVQFWNATSVGNTTNFSCDYVMERDVDILFITEAWLFKNMLLSKNSHQLDTQS